MAPKMTLLNVKIPGVEARAANVLKQDMLSIGGDAAVARGTVACSVPETDVLLMGTEKQLQRALEKFKKQPFGIKEIASHLELLLSALRRNDFMLRCRKGELALSERTHIMGILNVTPDSFSDGGDYIDPGKALERACRMVDEGADIIDVGGESTRPGAKVVPLDEELRRIIPVIERIAKNIKVPLSVDTCKAEVAKKAIDAGADIINDISGLHFDDKMASVAAKAACPVVVMHIKGRPSDMQKNPEYKSLMGEVIVYLRDSMDIALDAGVDPESIIVDPGIGFGKSFEDNLSILRNLEELKVLGRPVLVGASRKSFVGHLLGEAKVEDRLEGSLAASMFSAANGAHILRVHDIKETKKAVTVTDAIAASG
ncbi:MAG: dihydropteroate synthase [Proteobacteria bacterium]|nr:dihydropteroate synthase [Pseudomonadota bacterium]